MCQRLALDGVDESARLTVRRDQVVPAPGREVPALAAYTGDFGRNEIGSAKIVEQPRIDPFRAKRSLYCRHVEGAVYRGRRRRHPSSIASAPRPIGWSDVDGIIGSAMTFLLIALLAQAVPAPPLRT